MSANSERVDLFGRTETQMLAAIAKGEILLEIQKVWRGNDRLGAEIETAIRLLALDRRQLGILRGEVIDDSPRLSPAGRQKLYRELFGVGRSSRPR